MRPAVAGCWVLALCLSACARLTDHVVLLPAPDGSSGSLVVAAAAGEVVLAEPFAAADVAGGKATRTASSANMVRESYGRLLAMQPPRPRSYLLYFEFATTVLSAESRALLPRIRAEVAALPAGEAVVIGHTDRVGSLADNDRLSLQRAGMVRELLVAAGVGRDAITVAGRGEREPAVPTADNVAEARNRRVEIKLR